MDLFDPKFIRTKGGDSLIGKKVFFGDSMDDLKADVNCGEGVAHAVCRVADGGFIDDVRGFKWDYVYYDPLYAEKKAYAEGKQIQLWFPLSGKWEDVKEPQWHADRKYRIKPEGTWRPYKDFDEFLADVEERFPATRKRPEGTMPLIWVKLQKNHWTCRLITGYGINNGGTLFELQDKGYTCNAMFETFTYMDETPFGKKEQL